MTISNVQMIKSKYDFSISFKKVERREGEGKEMVKVLEFTNE